MIQQYFKISKYSRGSMIIASMCVAFVFAGCKKVLFEEEGDASQTSVFNEAWEFADKKYSFFEFKGIDWDSVKTVYEPKVTDDISDDSLFTVVGDMLYTLRDGHVNLSSSFDFSRNWSWFLDYPVNYDQNLIERNYFNDQQQFVGAFTLMDFDDVGYIHYSSFGRYVDEGTFNYILDKFSNHKGLIIDVRDNGGGAINNVYTMGSFFVNKETVVAYENFKNGPGEDDFSDLSTMSFTPVEEDYPTYENMPVVILTNRKCYSATNMFTTMMGALPNVTVIGDWTGGGGGVPTNTQLSNGWTVRVSSTQMFSNAFFNNEHGVPPDIQVDMDLDAAAQGEDSILEAALAYLRTL